MIQHVNLLRSAAENWTFNAIAAHYRRSDGNVRLILDFIKKDLQRRAKMGDSDAQRAEQLLTSDWKKSWIAWRRGSYLGVSWPPGYVSWTLELLLDIYAAYYVDFLAFSEQGTCYKCEISLNRRPNLIEAATAAFVDGAESMSKTRKAILGKIDNVTSGNSHSSTFKRKHGVYYDDPEDKDVEDKDQGDDDLGIHERIQTSSSSTSLFNDQRGSRSGPSFSDINEKNTSHSQDVSLRENSLASTEHENSAIWISDDDEDALIELCLPKEERTEMIERDEIDNGLLGRDWEKWAALLREAQKKSPHKHWYATCNFILLHVCTFMIQLNQVLSSSPENYCIIRCGAGIRLSNWMKKNNYQSLQTGLLKADRTSFVDFKSYMLSIFEEKSLKSMQQAIRLRAPPIVEPLGSKHYIIDQVFAQFAQKVFMPDNGDSDIKLSEICYNYLALWPCMYAAISGLTSNLGNLKFQPYRIPNSFVKYSGEKNLDAIDEIRRFRHQEESHMKVDRVVYTEFDHIELLSMEVTGHHGLHDKSRAGWDHVKGLCALLNMLSRIAYIFPHGSSELFQEVKVAFVHAHALVLWLTSIRTCREALHLWLFGMPSPGIFFMQRISKAIVPSKFDETWLLCDLINFLWTLRVEVLKTTKILEKLKTSHAKKALAIRLGESRGQCLYELLRPVTSPSKSRITTTTLDKKTEYAKVGEHVLPGSSPDRLED
ncbi:hypothetical protein BC936DRAFT_147649 [Jimgerdemannia flammicorona]|uniref:Uncharacterized protein n=1 Tax=Jimgerdemannia flammicorona TaxID=994334 RepID=A0A433DKV0_9FUNG|nr:hypothetical protein BC936DRAFT_147649 [Jimgerdemannia flammicorona]